MKWNQIFGFLLLFCALQIPQLLVAEVEKTEVFQAEERKKTIQFLKFLRSNVVYDLATYERDLKNEFKNNDASTKDGLNQLLQKDFFNQLALTLRLVWSQLIPIAILVDNTTRFSNLFVSFFHLLGPMLLAIPDFIVAHKLQDCYIENPQFRSSFFMQLAPILYIIWEFRVNKGFENYNPWNPFHYSYLTAASFLWIIFYKVHNNEKKVLQKIVTLFEQAPEKFPQAAQALLIKMVDEIDILSLEEAKSRYAELQQSLQVVINEQQKKLAQIYPEIKELKYLLWGTKLFYFWNSKKVAAVQKKFDELLEPVS